MTQLKLNEKYQKNNSKDDDEAHEDDLLTETELDQNEQKVIQKMSMAKKGIIILGIVLLISVGVFIYLFSPLTSKVSGSWQSESGLILESKNNSWTLKNKNFRDVEGFELVYKGVWQPHFPNKYVGKTKNVMATIDKKILTEENIAEIKQKNDLYHVEDETKTELILNYTKKGMQQITQSEELEIRLDFSLEPLSLKKTQQNLFLNNRSFSEDRIKFRFEK